jgi:SPP1 gp7 family putative phage head morphogenesis protein
MNDCDSLKKKTIKSIDKALGRFKDNLIDILISNATKAHLTGSLKGYKDLNIKPELDLVRSDSLNFAKAYKKLLVEDGATIIKGEKVAWLKDHNMETRKLVHDIIQKGLAEGKSPTIGKESIAKELGKVMEGQEYRMKRIARTEIAYIQNKGTVQSYKNAKVTKVQVLDNEGPNSCAECEEANGQIWTLEYADTHELEHPNCFIDHQIPIFTSEGWVPIGKIKVGNLVLTHEGRFKKVTELVQTPKQTPDVVTIEIGNSRTNNKKITVTNTHPILTVGGWKYAKDLTEHDNLKVLANKCQCGELIPYWKTICKVSCKSKETMLKLRQDPIWRDKSRIAQKKKMQEIYSNPENRKKQTASARVASMELLKNNNHPFQKLETHIKSNQALAKNKYRTYLEKKIAWLLNEMGISYIAQPIIHLEEKVNGRLRYYKPDFVLRDHKIIIECDGSYWHDKNNEYEIERQSYLESLGYLVIRFAEDDIRNNLELCQNTLTRILMNHNHEFNFLEMKIKSLKKWTPQIPKKLYNFSVEEDESYIANGIIVHNCVRAFVPIIDELSPE